MKKHIVCFGDSNTHGHCSEPEDCADGGGRFNEDERWPCLLQKALGEEFLVLEEGLSGRTTVFSDPLREGMSGLDAIYSCLMSHKPVDLLIIMLGTNDTKERFGANAVCIGRGMERLALKAASLPAWRDGKPRLLIIAPPHIGEGIYQDPGSEHMGRGCAEKSRGLAARYEELCGRLGFAFLDAEGLAEFNRKDFMHLTRLGHRQLAQALIPLIPKLLSE